MNRFSHIYQCTKYIQCAMYKVHTMCNVQSAYNVRCTMYAQCVSSYCMYDMRMSGKIFS